MNKQKGQPQRRGWKFWIKKEIFREIFFTEYLEVVQSVIESYDKNCSSEIKSVFEKLNAMLTSSKGRKDLSDTFRLFFENWLENKKQNIKLHVVKHEVRV